MTAISRRKRLLAAPVVLAIAAGSLAALAAPASAAKSTFSSTTDIRVGDPAFPVNQTTDISIVTGNATPYPSELAVARTETITDVNVRLNVSHTWPDDIDVMLVGPGGQQVMVMSDAGGSDDIAAVSLTFDDEAASLLPDGTQISSGSFRPTNFEAGDPFPAPAPGSTNNTSLSVFDGTSAAGNWQLYVRDDVGGDNGTVLSWGLTFEFAPEPNPSTIQVSGLPQVSDVNVGIQGMQSDDVRDLNLLLVGPGGQQSYLIGDSGTADAIANASFTFDDEAAVQIPAANTVQIADGASYQPFLQGDIEVFPGGPPASGSSVLSVFDGLSPNGEWRLFSMDDDPDLLTTISGWSLEFTWADTLNPSGSVVVANGAAVTSKRTVTLKLNANDPAPASGVTQMRFSNDGVNFSAYRPYAATTSWTLSKGEGKKTVYAQFRDADGNESGVVSDAIKYGVGPRAKSVSPKKNAKGVSRSVTIKVTANEKLKPSTVNGKKVFLKRQGSSAKVPARVSYIKKTKTIVLNPNGNLAANAKYTVTVKGVKDAKGNKWDQKPKVPGAQPLKYTFTTR